MSIKSYYFFAILLASSIFLNAQMYNPPGIRWKKETWAPTKYDLTTSQSQGESCDEWWYWHTNIYDPITGDHIGYAAAGYVSWVNTFYDETNGPFTSGCYQEGPAFGNHTVYYDRFEFDLVDNIPESYVGSFWSAIARFDLNGNMVWLKRFGKGEFRDIIQDEDGNLLAIGMTQSTVHLDASGSEADIICNPGTGQYIAECRQGSNSSVRRVSLVKTDLNGDLIANYCYGYYNLTNVPQGEDINDATSYGRGIVEVPSTNSDIQGRYYIIGDYDILPLGGGPNHNGAGLLILLDNNLSVVSTSSYGNGNESVELNTIQKFKSGNTEHYGIGGTIRAENPNMAGQFEWQPYLLVLNELGNERFTPKTYFDPRSNYFNRAKVTSISFSKQGDVYLSALYRKLTTYDYDSYVYKLNPSNGLTTGWTAPGISNPFYIANTNTYDNQLGISPPKDNDDEFAIVTSIHATNTHSPIENYFRQPNQHSTYASYWVNNHKGNSAAWEIKQVEDANGYIAKFIDIPSNNKPILKWEKEFDIDDAFTQRDYWPGDIKKQECLYSITKNDAGGYTVAGNCSENFDDGYIVNIHGDCGMDLSYTIGTTETEYVVASSTNETWNTSKTVRGIVRIQNNASLTISNTTIEFADSKNCGIETHIVVEEGGHLIISNSILTSDSRCDQYPWDGIKVRGNNQEPHTTTYQGKITMTNSTIENARWALVLGECLYDDTKSWNPNETYGGGIVNADNATFLNCRRSVHFSPYPYSISNPSTNTSYFEDCDFKNTQSLPGSYKVGAMHYVSMLGIQDVDYLGCHFTNDYVVSLGEDPFSSAIGGVDCGFYLLPSSSRSTLIERMKYGVEVRNTTFVDYPIDVISASFNENTHSIYLKNCSWPKIVANVFNVGYPGINDIPYGMYLYECQEYKVELNSFVNNAGSATHGVVINNSTEENNLNRIYDNDFRDFWIAVSGYDENRGLGPNTGLKILCNSFEGNDYDIHSAIGNGISSLQGMWIPGNPDPDAYVPAYNCFDACILPEGKLNNDALSILYAESATDPPCTILSSDPSCYDPSIVNFLGLSVDIQANTCNEYEYENQRPQRIANPILAFVNEIERIELQQSYSAIESTEYKALEDKKNRILGDMLMTSLRSDKEQLEKLSDLNITSNSVYRKIQLADLYTRLSQYDKARSLLNEIDDESMKPFVNYKSYFIQNFEKGHYISEIQKDLKFMSYVDDILADQSNYGYNNAKSFKNLVENKKEFYEEFADIILSTDEAENLDLINPNNIMVSVYPNPFEDIVNIKIESVPEQSTLSIYNVSGQEIEQYKLEGGKNIIQLRSVSLDKGFYFGKLYTNEREIKTFKLIKR